MLNTGYSVADWSTPIRLSMISVSTASGKVAVAIRLPTRHASIRYGHGACSSARWRAGAEVVLAARVQHHPVGQQAPGRA